MTILPLLLIFWVLQVAANIAFKYCSSPRQEHSRRWWLGFFVGNAVGAVSIYFLMLIFHLMPTNPNLAAVLATSGAFIASQITLALIFRSRLSPLQWAGVALVLAGTTLATLGGPVS